MSTLVVTAVAEPSATPPRVLVTVTDSGGPPITSVTVTRTGPEGISIVRTPDGEALTLVSLVGTVYDYEAAYGIAYTYSTVETPVTPGSPVTLSVSQQWLIHPGIPSLSVPVLTGMESHRDREYAVTQGVFWAHGRADPLVITDGARKQAVSELIVLTQTNAELDALRAIIRDTTPLLLNIPLAMQQGVPTSYLALGPAREVRESDVDAEPFFTHHFPYHVVARPVGGSQSLRTYADVLADHATYDVVRTTYSDYQDLLAP